MMPYIPQVMRDTLNPHVEALVKICMQDPFSTSPGVVNYTIFALIKGILGERYCYEDINEVIGVLECCKLELYRRVAAEYENKAIDRNGDIS